MSQMKDVRTLGSISRCEVRGCRGDGLWKPTVLAPYDGKVAEAAIQLHICTVHKNQLGDDYFKQVVYDTICRQVVSRHLTPPTFAECSVRWDKWNPGIITLDA